MTAAPDELSVQTKTDPTESQCDLTLSVNPAVAIIRCTDDEIFVRHGSRSTTTHRIEDTEHRGRLADFAAQFIRPTTARAAAEQCGIGLEDAEDFLEHLRTGRVLVTPDQRRFGQIIAGFGAENGVDAEPAVLGSGRVAAAVAAQLGDLLGAEVRLTGDVAEAFEGHDVVVVASDHPNPALGYDADAAAEETETPWQLVYVDGSEAVIGPTFVPGLTCNYYDLDSMDESGRTLRMDYQFLKSATPAIEATAEVPLFVAQLAASYASAAVVNHLTRAGSFLENRVLRIDLERMHVIRDRVLRLARNPRDIGARDDMRHPFL